MYRLTYELAVNDSRKAVAELLAVNASDSHALACAAVVLSEHTYKLHTLTLEMLGVQNNQYVVKRTLLRYERDGL